jgi:hypothetical protein
MVTTLILLQFADLSLRQILMQPNQQRPLGPKREYVRAKVHGSAREQISVVLPPAMIAIFVGWQTFTSLGDLPFSVVLSCVSFVTMAPMLTSMRQRGSARGTKIK